MAVAALRLLRLRAAAPASLSPLLHSKVGAAAAAALPTIPTASHLVQTYLQRPYSTGAPCRRRRRCCCCCCITKTCGMNCTISQDVRGVPAAGYLACMRDDMSKTGFQLDKLNFMDDIDASCMRDAIFTPCPRFDRDDIDASCMRDAIFKPCPRFDRVSPLDISGVGYLCCMRDSLCKSGNQFDNVTHMIGSMVNSNAQIATRLQDTNTLMTEIVRLLKKDRDEKKVPADRLGLTWNMLLGGLEAVAAWMGLAFTSIIPLKNTIVMVRDQEFQKIVKAAYEQSGMVDNVNDILKEIMKEEQSVSPHIMVLSDGTTTTSLDIWLGQAEARERGKHAEPKDIIHRNGLAFFTVYYLINIGLVCSYVELVVAGHTMYGSAV